MLCMTKAEHTAYTWLVQ